MKMMKKTEATKDKRLIGDKDAYLSGGVIASESGVDIVIY